MNIRPSALLASTAVAAAVLFSAPAARAQDTSSSPPLLLVLFNPYQTVTAPVTGDETVTFSGVAIDESAPGLISVSANYDLPRDANGDVLLPGGYDAITLTNPGDTFNGPIFSFDVNSATAPGNYVFFADEQTPSSAYLSGLDFGANGLEFPESNEVLFGVDVLAAPTPETGTAASMGLVLAAGIGALALGARRRTAGRQGR